MVTITLLAVGLGVAPLALLTYLLWRRQHRPPAGAAQPPPAGGAQPPPAAAAQPPPAVGAPVQPAYRWRLALKANEIMHQYGDELMNRTNTIVGQMGVMVSLLVLAGVYAVVRQYGCPVASMPWWLRILAVLLWFAGGILFIAAMVTHLRWHVSALHQDAPTSSPGSIFRARVIRREGAPWLHAQVVALDNGQALQHLDFDTAHLAENLSTGVESFRKVLKLMIWSIGCLAAMATIFLCWGTFDPPRPH